MRGDDQKQNHIFSYLSPEARVRNDHPLRAIRAMVDEVLRQLSRRFDMMYARVGRPSIVPEKLLRAELLQMLYSIRSERLLIEEMDYNLLFRWFGGLNADDDVWDATVFTKNRDWHETYFRRGGIEAVYDDVPQSIGLMGFAPVVTARGPMFGAASRAGK